MWRWYKTFKFGIFNTTVSKTGVGWSVGVPGIRYGINASGKKYWSLGFAGFRFIKYLSAPVKSKDQITKNQSYGQIKTMTPKTPNEQILENLRSRQPD